MKAITKGVGGEPVNIAFCVDRHALKGLHITLASTLAHCSDERELLIHVLHNGLRTAELDSLRRTIDRARKRAVLLPTRIDLTETEACDAFYGGHMAYARLLLANHIRAPKVVYLDADLIVGLDVCALYDYELSGYPLGAVFWHRRVKAQDSQLFVALDCDMDLPYFNSGVLLIDIERWCRDRITNRLLTKGAELSGRLISHDQSLINLCLENEILELPRRFNTTVSPRTKLLPNDSIKSRIIHLLARPKPWDLFGRLNGQYSHYKTYLPLTDALTMKQRTALNMAEFSGVIRSARAYIKCLIPS